MCFNLPSAHTLVVGLKCLLFPGVSGSANVESGHRQLMLYFGSGCAADADRPAMDAFLGSGGFESEQEALRGGAGTRRRPPGSAAAQRVPTSCVRQPHHPGMPQLCWGQAKISSV